MEYEGLATKILQNVGGKENIQSVIHCYTRLRFVLKDESLAQTKIIEGLSGVSGVIKSNNQYQVVIGNQVDDVFAALEKVGGFNRIQEEQVSSNNKFSLVDTVTAIFMPIMGVLCATGMIKGITTLLLILGILSETSNVYTIFLGLGDTVLYFFPIFLGYTACKRFGGNPFIGMVIGASLVYPTIIALASGEATSTLFGESLFEVSTNGLLFGIPFVAVNYTTTVFPIILAVLLAAKLEVFIKSWMPKVLNSFMTPALVLIIILPLTLLIIGPIVTILSSLIAQGISALQGINYLLAAIVIGVLWQVLIMFGLHGMIFPIIFINLGMQGFDTIFPAFFVCSFTQVAACFAIALKEKNIEKRSLAISSGVSAIFGITEPAIYGISLPNRNVFISTLIASGIGSAIIGFLKVRLFTLGGMGIFGFFNFISPEGTSYISITVIAVIVAMVISFGLTWIWGYKPKNLPGAINQKSFLGI